MTADEPHSLCRAAMRIAVAGAGGHAKVVADALLAAGKDDFAGFLDDDPASWGLQILGYPVLGPLTAWSNKKIDGIVVAVGENAARKLMFEQLMAAGATLVSRSCIRARSSAAA
jgi:acetyltransferase EpsM